MIKKVLITLLIVLLLAGGVAYYSFKKLESQFDNFMMSRVEANHAETESTNEEILTVEVEEETTVEIKDEFKEVPSKEEVVEEATEVVSNGESVEDTTEETTVVEVVSEVTSSDEVVKASTEELPVDEETQVVEDETSIETSTIETVEETNEEVYTEEQFQKDKLKAMELALRKLTPSQISRLMDLSSGGFTPEEKEEAKAMFYSNFTADEQTWILGIYDKYYSSMKE